MEEVFIIFLFIFVPFILLVALIFGSISSREKTVTRALQKGSPRESILKIKRGEIERMIGDVNRVNKKFLNNPEIRRYMKEWRKILNKVGFYDHYVLPESMYRSLKEAWMECYPFLNAQSYDIEIDLSDEEEEKSHEDQIEVMIETVKNHRVEVDDYDSYEEEEEEMDYIDEYEMYDAIFDDDE